MPTLKINGTDVTVPAGTLLLDACKAAGADVPHYCYHPSLSTVATCRMCVVEVKGQPKLATSCSTPVMEGMDVRTDSQAVADARAGVMEFLLINHPLDCPICDQAGECKLQDYSYAFGSDDSRMVEAKRRYGYEDLGARIVIDKNRCIHCTRCVRFTQEVSRTHELLVANRGSQLEVTTYAGKSMDDNPLAGNVVDICPVGALTSRDFRFNKRVWYLKPVPTISRHGAEATPIWADVDQNRVWRFRPRPEAGRPETRFILDEERYAYHRYNLDPATRVTTPLLRGSAAPLEAIRAQVSSAAGWAVVGQGTFGCDGAQRLGALASAPELRLGSGDRVVPVRYPSLQRSEDGIFNRRGFEERGFQFGRLPWLLDEVRAGRVQVLVVLHDEAFSSPEEQGLLNTLVAEVPVSVVLEPVPSPLSGGATLVLPTATYLEENDFVVTHEGRLVRYARALQPPKGVRTIVQWSDELAKLRPQA